VANEGAVNWYKVRLTNYLDEKNLESLAINVPYLFIAATYDSKSQCPAPISRQTVSLIILSLRTRKLTKNSSDPPANGQISGKVHPEPNKP
jgi:hypothetical protein